MAEFLSAGSFSVLVLLACCMASVAGAQLLNTSSSAAVPPQCQDHIEVNDCEFYRCIEAQLQCGEEGYPLRYGYRYCRRFAERSRHFNNEVNVCGFVTLSSYFLSLFLQGKQWILDVMKCLMKESSVYGELLTSNSCTELEHRAFQSHSNCYINNGFCSVILQWTNMKEFLSVLQFPDIIGWNFLQQVNFFHSMTS